MNPERWTLFEKKACEGADQIIAVVDEMKARIVREHGIREEKITVITNTEDQNFVKQTIDTSVYKTLEGKFIITYSGGIGPHRGVDTAIEGMQYLKQNEQIQLAIVGFGSPSVMNNLQQKAADLQLKNVHFFGYQPFSKFYSYMHLTDVNVIPHQSNGHTDNTVPHKLFQGMMAGKPLLVSSSAPLKRLVEAYQSGVVFEAGNPKDFANKVMSLYENKNVCIQLGSNGIKATLDGDLNWETTQQSLIDLYTTI